MFSRLISRPLMSTDELKIGRWNWFFLADNWSYESQPVKYRHLNQISS